MVGTIGPVVHRGGWARSVALLAIHTVGYGVGGALTGIVCGTVGYGLGRRSGDSIAVSVTAAMALVISARDGGLLPLRLPQCNAQVPVSWQAYPLPVMVLLYGFGLGIGFLTRIVVGTFYIIVLWLLMSGSATGGALVVGCFGIGRAIPLWLTLKSYDVASRMSLRVLSAQDAVRLLNGMSLAALGTMLILHLVRG